MDEGQVDDDDDLAIQRASGKAIGELKRRVHRLVDPHPRNRGNRVLNVKSCSADVTRVNALLDLFQEDPQLLDPHLKHLLPSLESRYLELISLPSFYQEGSLRSVVAASIAKILSTFCKVRGEKVVSRFLNNEARNLDVVLNALEHVEAKSETTQTWEQQYVLLLWLAHLLLTPFDLSTVSTRRGHLELYDGFESPEDIPGVSLDVLNCALRCVSSPTKQQKSAAALLVRIALRPDMRAIGLTDSLTRWAVYVLKNADASHRIHLCIGALRVVAGLSAPANAVDVGAYLPRFYLLIRDLYGSDSNVTSAYQQSAVARQLAIKIQRNVIISSLRTDAPSNKDLAATAHKLLEEMSGLEEVIEFLLEAMSDRHTPVRLAASKALSVIALKMEASMAEEVVDAILGSLQEDLVSSEAGPSTHGVNPLKWHGLTLTLAHMLFRRSPSPAQLPEILSALYIALAFEQRTALGSAIGSNVRDAANFGLWSLARKYSPHELSAVSFSKSKLQLDAYSLSDVFQLTPCHLVTSACLDPIGNIRRGSSAALQEFIGRHPNRIHEGISLVQAVDYQGVGLRSRAVRDVSFNASVLGRSLRTALLDGLLGWRGVSTPDCTARENAASSFGQLSGLCTRLERQTLLQKCKYRLMNTPHGQIEERHGLVLSLAATLFEVSRLASASQQSRDTAINGANEELFCELGEALQTWQNLGKLLSISAKDLTLPSLRPSLTASGVLSLIGSLGQCSRVCMTMQKDRFRQEHVSHEPPSTSLQLLNLCLKAVEVEKLPVARYACERVVSLMVLDDKRVLVQEWLDTLSHAARPSRCPGLMIAIACGLSSLRHEEGDLLMDQDSLQRRIIDTLMGLMSPLHEIEARVVACRSLGILAESVASASIQVSSTLESCILTSVSASLQDYTTNERGDVGSLLRLASLEVIDTCWLHSATADSPLDQECRCAVYQLAVEKLDKVRLRAAGVLAHHAQPPFDQDASLNILSLRDVSSYEYFYAMATVLERTLGISSVADVHSIPSALTASFISSTSPSSPALADTARSALLAVLDGLPIWSENSNNPSIVSIVSIVERLLSKTLAATASTDRLLTPTLDFLAFLLDAGLPQKIQALNPAPKQFKPRTLLSLVQKAHFKSTNIPRLLSAIDCYRGLIQLTAIRAEVFAKLKGMLAHPFPKVRMAAAETLWVTTWDDGLRDRKWAGDGLVDKGFVMSLQLG
ncbi:MAG: hypothetical protein M1828_004664 [Chrysothrix sp. TS-e1954]|nr:MAG: hypothetical protein M1828_004664 [Chrysothrix sp. TS-e1954]